jgi:uncharacterized protein
VVATVITSGNEVTFNVLQHSDAGAFLRRAEAWLLQQEAGNNILLSVAYLLERGAKPFHGAAFLATVEQHDEVCGCVICPPPDGVYMTAIPPSAVRPVSEMLRAMFDSVPELLGPEPAATLFAAQWAPDAWHINNRFRRYRLDRVSADAKASSGYLRLGKTSDLPVLENWAANYRREARANPDIAALFRIMLERNSLYVWDDDGPRCVVTASGFTPNGARISSTYTPPEFRRNGYARSAVSAVCQQLLDSGRRFCVIVADVDEPAPNAVYAQIGFQPTGEILLIHFHAHTDPLA